MKKIMIIVSVMLLFTGMLTAHAAKAESLKRARLMPGSIMEHSHRFEDAGRREADRQIMHCRRRVHQKDMVLSLKKLDLSDEQKEQIQKLQFEYRLEAIDLQAELRKLALKRRNYLGNADFSNAKTVSEEYFGKRAEIAEKRIALYQKIHNLLDEDQQKEFKTFLMKHTGKR